MNHVYTHLCFRCNTVTLQEVLVKWHIMMMLEQMCLISSTDWCAATLFSPFFLLLSEREWSWLSLYHQPARIYIQQVRMQNPLAIENSEVIPAEQRSFFSPQMKQGKERERKQKGSRRLKCCLMQAAKLKKCFAWKLKDIYCILHRTTVTSPSVP